MQLTSGCFSDPADSRVFEFESSDPAMTAEVCSGLCSGSTFYGTQYGAECWCGNNEDYDANGDGVCDMSCSGDSDEICGGFYSMTVYENPESDYLGCYSDPADDRIFERMASSDDMTAAVCLGYCGAYQYYGTQYSTECWCGNNANYDANGDGVCDMSCSGNSGEVCGGSYSMSVYENPDSVFASEYNYRGCYSDPADWRDWVARGFVQSDSSSAMTTELCASQCSDSAFYGTQYSIECWCGDYNARYSTHGEGVCDMPCSGDPDETCGGYYSMDVYASDPAYIGCAQDSMDRMFDTQFISDDMTAETCAGLCSGLSGYYGTQHSEECWCGEIDGDLNPGVCGMPCTGDSDEICGGSYAMSVYQYI